MLLQPLHPVRRLPRVVIPAQRGDIRPAGVAEPTRSWLSWDTSAPVIPSSRVRQSGTLPYSSTTGRSVPVLYSTCPWRITRPADGSQVSVPPPCPVTVYDPAYPSVAVTGVVADRSCRVTAAVAGAAAPCCPDPDEAAGENTPARHAAPPAADPPATTTTTMPSVHPAATATPLPFACL